jgi:hypothetical protein
MLEALFVLAVLGLGGGAFALASVGPEGAKDPRRLAVLGAVDRVLDRELVVSTVVNSRMPSQ